MFTKTTIGERKCFKLFRSVRVASANGSATEQINLVNSSLWASIKPLSGRRLIEAQQIAQGITHEMVSGHFEPIPDQTFFFERNNKRYVIQSVINPDEDNVTLKYMVSERVVQ